MHDVCDILEDTLSWTFGSINISTKERTKTGQINELEGTFSGTLLPRLTNPIKWQARTNLFLHADIPFDGIWH